MFVVVPEPLPDLGRSRTIVATFKPDGHISTTATYFQYQVTVFVAVPEALPDLGRSRTTVATFKPDGHISTTTT